MTDKSAFTDAEWHALSDAPLLVTLALFATGEHGPISMVKEATASARAIAAPGEHGAANALIAEIAAAAETKEARHDMKEHRGHSMEEALQRSLADLAPAADALKKIPVGGGGRGCGLAARHRRRRGPRGEGREARGAGRDRPDQGPVRGQGLRPGRLSQALPTMVGPGPAGLAHLGR